MDKLIYTQYGEKHPLELCLEMYKNGNLAIETFTWIEGFPEPYGFLTVNIDRRPLNCAFIDTNNNGEAIIGFILQNKLGELTGNCGCSGRCRYPEVRFFKDVLTDIDEESYGEYLSAQSELEIIRAVEGARR